MARLVLAALMGARTRAQQPCDEAGGGEIVLSRSSMAGSCAWWICVCHMDGKAGRANLRCAR